MKHLLALLLALTASAAGATTPVLVPTRTYYGPLRICTPLFAFDVRADEGYIETGNSHVVRFGRHMFGFGQRWHYGDPAFRDIVRPMGSLALPGLGRLERVELSSRNSPAKTILYLYDIGDRSLFPKVEIGSDAFDGSERDLALLNRLVFGEAARAMCAGVPEALRPRPEREDKNAFWVSPVRPAGPLTLCWAGLALDVRAGEAAIRFWSRDWQMFGVATDDGNVTIQGSLPWLRDAAGRTFDGPFAASAEFEIRPIVPPFQVPPPIGAAEGAVPRYVRLQRPVRLPHPEIAYVQGVVFAFSGPQNDARIAAFVGRLRPRTAADACFEETSP